MDGWRLGLRAHHRGVEHAVRTMLGDRAVRDPLAPPTYSIRAATGTGRGPAQSMHVLYHRHKVHARSRRLARLLHALAEDLAHHLAPAPGLVTLDQRAMVSAQGAFLLPRLAAGPADVWARQMERHGILAVHGPAQLDPATGELVVREPRLVPPADAVALADEVLPGRGDLPAWAPPGRHRVVGWGLLLGGELEQADDLDEWIKLWRAMLVVRPESPVPAQDQLDAVAMALASVRWWRSLEGEREILRVIDVLGGG